MWLGWQTIAPQPHGRAAASQWAVGWAWAGRRRLRGSPGARGPTGGGNSGVNQAAVWGPEGRRVEQDDALDKSAHVASLDGLRRRDEEDLLRPVGGRAWLG